MNKIKVLLIEDNRFCGDGPPQCSRTADIRVVSSAGNRNVLEKAKKLLPDVVIA